MANLRNRLESYVVRQTGDLVDDLADERRQDLAEVLHDLEGYSPRAAEAEQRTEDLVEKLEHRNVLVSKARARIEELERELADARKETDDRNHTINAELEAERIRAAEREQNLRAKLDVREAELRHRAAALEERERELLYTDRELAERERTVSVRETGVQNRARELEGRSDERLAERERHLADREAQLESLERMAANEKQSLERRSIHVTELERRAELRLGRLGEREQKLVADTESLEKRATELAHLDEQLERRKRELDSYVARVQERLGPRP